MAEAAASGEFRAPQSIVWRDYRIVFGKPPFGTVLCGDQPQFSKMALDSLVSVAVLKADQVVRRDRLADLNDRLQLLLRLQLLGNNQALKRSMYGCDHGRQVGPMNCIVGYI